VSRAVEAKGETKMKAAAVTSDVVKQLDDIESDGGNGTLLLGAQSLAVTHLGKVFFPESGYTKGDLMRYYSRVASVLLPVLEDRPLVLKRWPAGIAGQPFFQQKPPDKTPKGVRVERVPAEGALARRIVGGDLLTQLYCVQLGVIATNCWHSRVGSLRYPDYTVIDLDPGPKAPFRRVVQIARWLEELLDQARLKAAVKTSGKSGIHVYIPLPPRANDEAARLVAQIFAQRVADAHPREATTTRVVKARSATSVYVDYLQNVVGKSIASAFSVRSRPGATVSTPVSWDELTDDLDPRDFTIESVVKEATARGKLWSKAMGARNALSALTTGGRAVPAAR
jgi:bifunctional non-homologous end joining protein LigD